VRLRGERGSAHDRRLVRLRGGRQRGDRARLEPPAGALPLDPEWRPSLLLGSWLMPPFVQKNCGDKLSSFASRLTEA
jgi:hypothetical protein